MTIGALLPGTTIRKKYRIIKEIGRGGMGVVYHAEHLLFREERAIKVIKEQFASDPQFAERFAAEILITRQLNHPNIVRVEDADETEDGCPIVVMEYVRGESLGTLMARGGVDTKLALSIAAQVCSGLAAAHRRNIVHRDIKPDNILVSLQGDGNEIVKVVDFGIAKFKQQGGSDAPTRNSTQTGLFLGTPDYASPEQALGKGGAELDGRTDIYSLGVVLYQMLAKRLPFTADTARELLRQHQATPPPLLSPGVNLPQSVIDVTMKALRKNPAERFESAEEMRMALQQAANSLRRPRSSKTEKVGAIAPRPFGAPAESSQPAQDKPVHPGVAVKSAPAGPDSRIEPQLAAARELISRKELEAAASLLALTLTRDPHDPRLISLLREVQELQEEQNREDERRKAIDAANELLAACKYSGAIDLLENAIGRLGALPDIAQLLQVARSKQREERRRLRVQQALEAVREPIANERFDEAIELLEAVDAEVQSEEIPALLTDLQARKARAARLAGWMDRIDRALQAKEYESAERLVKPASAEFANDPRFRKLAGEVTQRAEAHRRAQRAEAQLSAASKLLEQGDHQGAAAILRAVDPEFLHDARFEALRTTIETAEKQRREAEEKQRREAEEKLRREAEEKLRREAEEKLRRETEEKQRREAEEKQRRETEEKLRRETEEKLRREAAEKLRREAEEKLRREFEEKLRRAFEEKLRREAEEKQRREAAEKLQREAEEKQRREAAEKLQREAEEKQRQRIEQPSGAVSASGLRLRFRPLTEQQVLGLIRDLSGARVRQIISTCAVSFDVDAPTEKRLAAAGAPPSLIALLREKSQAAATLASRLAESEARQDFAQVAVLLRGAADAGNADAQYKLGYMSEIGQGVPHDYREAAKWYRQAEECGHVAATAALGALQYYGWGVARNDAEAVARLRKAAEGGNALAQQVLGDCYRYSRGVAKDEGEAVRWYRKAAEQGDVYGQLRMGEVCEAGLGVTIDRGQANEWYRKVAGRFAEPRLDPRTEEAIALMYQRDTRSQKDQAEAVRWFRRAAERGRPIAQVFLGHALRLGSGAAKDASEAAAWYRKAAEQGDTEGQLCAALMAADPAEAAAWYRKAAEYNSVAAFNLGSSYESGRGVAPDSAEAAKWYRRAAEAGNAMAQAELGRMYLEGTGVDSDYAEAAAWFRKSAAAPGGNVFAEVNLGDMYAEGKLFPVDYREAANWYRGPAELKEGYSEAQRRLGRLYEEGGYGLAQDDVAAYTWYALAEEANDREAGPLKTELAKRMSAARIEEAVQRARQWRAKHRKPLFTKGDPESFPPPASGALAP